MFCPKSFHLELAHYLLTTEYTRKWDRGFCGRLVAPLGKAPFRYGTLGRTRNPSPWFSSHNYDCVKLLGWKMEITSFVNCSGGLGEKNNPSPRFSPHNFDCVNILAKLKSVIGLSREKGD